MFVHCGFALLPFAPLLGLEVCGHINHIDLNLLSGSTFLLSKLICVNALKILLHLLPLTPFFTLITASKSKVVLAIYHSRECAFFIPNVLLYTIQRTTKSHVDYQVKFVHQDFLKLKSGLIVQFSTLILG